MSLDPVKVAAIKAGILTGAPAVCEYIKVYWSASEIRYYGGAAWQDEDPFTAIGVDVEPRIIYKNPDDPFTEFEINADLRTDTVTITFSDLGDPDEESIRGLFKTYKSGVRMTINRYYPDEDLHVELWKGQLQAPKNRKTRTVEAVATNGYRSKELKVPGSYRRRECRASKFGGELPTLDAVRSNLCPYDKHLGGSEGLYKTGTTPFTGCPRDEAACQARFGHTRYFGGYRTDAAAVVTDPNVGHFWLAVSKGNKSNTDPIRVVAGTKTVRNNQVLMFRNELNAKDPKKSWVSAVVDIAEGPIQSIGNFKCQGRVIQQMHFDPRLGTRGQPPSNYAPNVANFSSTAHVNFRLGWVNLSDEARYTADDFTTEAQIQGFNEVCVYTGPTTKTRTFSNDRVWWILELLKNQKFGMGYAEDQFEISDWIDAAAWGNETVSFTATSKDGETKTYQSRRTKFDAILEGRAATETLEDICRAGNFSVPFLHEGKYTIVPFRQATTTELNNAPVFYDKGENVNINWEGGEPAISFSEIPDDKVVNEVEVRFEEAANGHTERPLFFEDPDQKRRAGRQLGSELLLPVPKTYGGSGITEEAEAARFGYTVLKFGPLEEGGTHNNLDGTITGPFEMILGLMRYSLIKIVSDQLDQYESPEGDPFEYFRAMKIKAISGNRFQMSIRAYNHAAYTTLGTTTVDPAYSKISVIGAGDALVNGVYIYAGQKNSKPSYTRGDCTILWTGSQWVLYRYSTAGTSETLYSSSSSVAGPWLAIFTVVNGIEPAPTISLSADTDFDPPDWNPCRLELSAVSYDEATGQITMSIEPC